MVAIEGMSQELPIKCTNTGEYGVNADNSCVTKVEPAYYLQVVNNLEQAIYILANYRKFRISLGKAVYLHSKATFKNHIRIKNFQ